MNANIFNVCECVCGVRMWFSKVMFSFQFCDAFFSPSHSLFLDVFFPCFFGSLAFICLNFRRFHFAHSCSFLFSTSFLLQFNSVFFSPLICNKNLSLWLSSKKINKFNFINMNSKIVKPKRKKKSHSLLWIRSSVPQRVEYILIPWFESKRQVHFDEILLNKFDAVSVSIW